MDIDKEREAFEKWVTDDGKYPDCATRLDGTDTYKLITTHLYWQAWKSRAEIEDLKKLQDNYIRWKPIETAPKDIEIIVYAPSRYDLDDMVAKCKWHDDAGFCIDELRIPMYWIDKP